MLFSLPELCRVWWLPSQKPSFLVRLFKFAGLLAAIVDRLDYCRILKAVWKFNLTLEPHVKEEHKRVFRVT